MRTHHIFIVIPDCFRMIDPISYISIKGLNHIVFFGHISFVSYLIFNHIKFNTVGIIHVLVVFYFILSWLPSLFCIHVNEAAPLQLNLQVIEIIGNLFCRKQIVRIGPHGLSLEAIKKRNILSSRKTAS